MKKSAVPVDAPKPPKARGRPRSFDRESALAAAMDVFWKKGFEAASISDLTEAMGINPPSLYAAFGDKEQLFLEAMERYERSRGDSCPYSDEATARAAIERLLTYMATDLTGSDHPRGCMMLMAVATSANASARLKKAVTDKRVAAREHLRARIKRGIEEGDVPRGADASALADFYSTVMNGMAMMARDGVSRRSLLATVEQAMQLFPASSARGKRREAAAA
ncbi:MAG TPA: TetR/AcrR family transcriptional regulator [Usitatibacter sp.]|jgi:AcrR family transcriptional regulator|nr:TetR/AcrR family transcriptional regulator [Usitatibacter sp.]